MDISKLDIKDLKALAYDFLAQIENGQKNLQIVNAEIAKRGNQPIQTSKQAVEEAKVVKEEPAPA